MSYQYVITFLEYSKRQLLYLSSSFVIGIFFLEDSKWQPLYLSSLYVIGIFFGKQQVAAPLFEQLVRHNFLEDSK